MKWSFLYIYLHILLDLYFTSYLVNSHSFISNHEANSERSERSNEESDLATLILKWILGMAKSMIGELMEKFASLVNDIFQQKPAAELTDHMEEKLRSSLLLSVVILVIVVVGRSGGV